MKFLRSRAAIAFFFGIISLGQAYPFSVAWGMYKNSPRHICCCRGSAEICRCHHGHNALHSSHKDKNPGYAALPCGGKTQDEILSFRGDPFVPSESKPVILSLQTRSVTKAIIPLPSVFRIPEAPPPKSLG